MKKYIRTKDTIFAVVSENDKVFIVRAKGNPNHLYNKSKINTEILGESDKIEDLCDGFIVDDGKFWALYTNLKIAKLIKGNLYGCIKKEKSTDYVAKYNRETGEFELLWVKLKMH